MSRINFVGSYSGIDQSMIDELMAAEKLPLIQLSNKKVNAEEKQNAWKDINTRLNTLFEKIKVLQNQTTFTSRTTSTTNKDVVTMTAKKNAALGSYKVHVQQLATNTSVISGKTDLGALKGEDGKLTGTFTITNAGDGTEGSKISKEIDLAGSETLKDVADKINAVTDGKDGTGISASIIDNRLVLTDEKTGERGITLDGDDNVLKSLGLGAGEHGVVKPENPITPIVPSGMIVNAGQKAIFTVNGVTMERDSNTISDAIEDITINLHGIHGEGATDTVKISLDSGQAEKAIKEFVDQYNSVMNFIEEKTKPGNPDVKDSRGVLAGDSSLTKLHSSLRKMVTDRTINGNTKIGDISRLGVTTKDESGVLQFDPTVLRDALARNEVLTEGSDEAKDSYSMEDIMNFFSSKVEGEDIGFASKLNKQIDSYISKDKGIVKTRTESLEKTLKNLDKQIENFNARMERREAYYVKMFTALDVAMMKAESQMSWLQGQVDMMSGSRK